MSRKRVKPVGILRKELKPGMVFAAEREDKTLVIYVVIYVEYPAIRIDSNGHIYMLCQYLAVLPQKGPMIFDSIGSPNDRLWEGSHRIV